MIVIDDDIQLHPGTIRSWVEEMERDPAALLASGYAFEYVAPGVSSWTPYLWMLWRLNASSGFSDPRRVRYLRVLPFCAAHHASPHHASPHHASQCPTTQLCTTSLRTNRHQCLLRSDRPVNCWGGAMMFRAEELRANIYGIIDAWRDGGYSEDFISLSLARLHRRTIAVPKAALFPNMVRSAVPVNAHLSALTQHWDDAHSDTPLLTPVSCCCPCQ